MEHLSEELFKTIRRIQIQTTHLADDVLAGAYHSAFKGKGIEFEEVREYQPGDEIRSIDWNVTARMNHPYIKLFKEERELTILLVVDASSSCRFGSLDKVKSELIAEVGALLAFSAIKNSDKVGLVLFTDHVEKYLPPRKGLRHVLRLIRELLYFTPTHKETDIAKALAFVGKVHPKSSVCFVLSDFLSRPFDREWNLLAQRHDLIAMSVTTPNEQHFPPVGLAMLKDLETGDLACVDTSDTSVKKTFQENIAEEHGKLKELSQRSGTSWIQLSTDQPPLAAIKKFFKMRSRR